jgi:hypothetical protein
MLNPLLKKLLFYLLLLNGNGKRREKDLKKNKIIMKSLSTRMSKNMMTVRKSLIHTA